MAKLQVSADALLGALFPDRDFLTLEGLEYDQQRELVTLRISGHGVPEVEEVVATITVRHRETRFEPAPPREPRG